MARRSPGRAPIAGAVARACRAALAFGGLVGWRTTPAPGTRPGADRKRLESSASPELKGCGPPGNRPRLQGGLNGRLSGMLLGFAAPPFWKRPAIHRPFASTSPPLWNFHSEHWRRPFGDRAADRGHPTTTSSPKTARGRPVRHPWPPCAEAARPVFSRLSAAMTPKKSISAPEFGFPRDGC